MNRFNAKHIICLAIGCIIVLCIALCPSFSYIAISLHCAVLPYNVLSSLEPSTYDLDANENNLLLSRVQGINWEEAKGTCGESALSNVINLITETNVSKECYIVSYAFDNQLCAVDEDLGSDCGGTNAVQLAILFKEMMGEGYDCAIFSGLYHMPAEEIYSLSEQGYVIIISISHDLSNQSDDAIFDSNTIYDNDHWIMLAGMTVDEETGEEKIRVYDTGGYQISSLTFDELKLCYDGTDEFPLRGGDAIIFGKISSAENNTKNIENIVLQIKKRKQFEDTLKDMTLESSLHKRNILKSKSLMLLTPRFAYLRYV